jgi:hypothetical protein
MNVDSTTRYYDPNSICTLMYIVSSCTPEATNGGSPQSALQRRPTRLPSKLVTDAVVAATSSADAAVAATSPASSEEFRFRPAVDAIPLRSPAVDTIPVEALDFIYRDGLGSLWAFQQTSVLFWNPCDRNGRRAAWEITWELPRSSPDDAGGATSSTSSELSMTPLQKYELSMYELSMTPFQNREEELRSRRCDTIPVKGLDFIFRECFYSLWSHLAGKVLFWNGEAWEETSAQLGPTTSVWV